MDKLSYALGLSMGNNFKSSGIQTLSVTDFANGVKAVYEGEKPEMTYDEAKQVINDFFTQMQREVNDRNRAEGEAFLAENKKKSGVVVLPSGLQYEVLTDGKGKKPAATDRVQCHYHGTLINGEVAYGENGAGGKIAPNSTLIFDVELLKVL